MKLPVLASVLALAAATALVTPSAVEAAHRHSRYCRHSYRYGYSARPHHYRGYDYGDYHRHVYRPYRPQRVYRDYYGGYDGDYYDGYDGDYYDGYYGGYHDAPGPWLRGYRVVPPPRCRPHRRFGIYIGF